MRTRRGTGWGSWSPCSGSAGRRSGWPSSRREWAWPRPRRCTARWCRWWPGSASGRRETASCSCRGTCPSPRPTPRCSSGPRCPARDRCWSTSVATQSCRNCEPATDATRGYFISQIKLKSNSLRHTKNNKNNYSKKKGANIGEQRMQLPTRR